MIGKNSHLALYDCSSQLAASGDVKSDQEVRWITACTKEEDGMVDTESMLGMNT